jgi:hypothetical protein
MQVIHEISRIDAKIVEDSTTHEFIVVGKFSSVGTVYQITQEMNFQLPTPGGGGDGSQIGGFPVVLSGLSTGDVLGFSSGSWVNTDRETLTDGGNF